MNQSLVDHTQGKVGNPYVKKMN